MGDLPGLVFLGYQVKVPWTPDANWDPDNKKTGVVEVRSASDSLSNRPPDWIQHWTHNRAWSGWLPASLEKCEPGPFVAVRVARVAR